MRRMPALINLCDKPVRSRPALFSHSRMSFGDGISRLCACVLIAAVTLGWFSVYGLIAHREPAHGPLSLRAHALEYRSDRASTPAALAPDMNSEAVRHANADVPVELQSPEQKTEPNKANHAAASHRKNKVTVTARRQRKPVVQTHAWRPRTQAYAWGPRTFQGPFRGY